MKGYKTMKNLNTIINKMSVGHTFNINFNLFCVFDVFC